MPPVHGRRSMLDACCYVLRTGCARRMLPQGFPLWDNVYETFRRESAQGSLSRCIIVCGRSAGSARRELSSRRPCWMPIHTTFT
ncbi:transposase [Pseudomonas tumuqii]|uniref:transposase n=1 Tax=Pseudomonas tumuqii TaxID=2715755 RepID=UPI0036F264E0